MEDSKRIGVISLAKLQAGLFAFVGLLAGTIYSFGGAIVDALVSNGWITTTATPGLSWGTALAFLALIGMPGVFATFGLITGAVGALLYNLVAGRDRGRDKESGDPNGLSWKDWGVIIVGGAIVGALVGAILGGFFDTQNNRIEAVFGGGFYGAFIGGGFFGNLLGIIRHHRR
jgi:integral membrane sensor domain MASE1